MESTNVDHLFRNYLVSDVILVQQKLKNDVEKKQNDLKQLIGYDIWMILVFFYILYDKFFSTVNDTMNYFVLPIHSVI